jgi:glyceraldehyde 3-phosphate dehydrogenase
MNIAINGFGRIGRAAFKLLFDLAEKNPAIKIVAINDLTSAENLAYLLKYDTVYGRYSHPVSFDEKNIIVNEIKFPHYMIKDAATLPWKDLNVDVVIECTGVFTKSEDAKKHLAAGARKVLLSAPAKDDGFNTVVLGGGKDVYEGDLISNASCTTNNVIPVLNILDKAFGIEKSLMTTIHAYTATQGLVDGPNAKDFRSGRSGSSNVIPHSTGAAEAVVKALPLMDKKFDGLALRVPVICGSISDITAVLKRDVTKEEINEAFKIAQKDPQFLRIVKYTEDPIVSSDILQTPYSAIIDGQLTKVIGGNMIKVMAWYDNEWGYSNRLVETALKLGQSL